MPLRKCSRTILFINTNTKDARVSLVLPLQRLHNLDENDTNVCVKNLIDKYEARPDDLDNMTLADFAAEYTYTKSNETSSENEFLDDDDEDSERESEGNAMSSSLDRITLKNGFGVMKKRQKRAIIRCHSFNPDTEAEKYYHSRLMLLLPWHSEDEIIGNCSSYYGRYTEIKNTILNIERRFIHHETDINSAFQQLQEEGPSQSAWDSIAPTAVEDHMQAEEQGVGEEKQVTDEDMQDAVNGPSHARSQTVHDKFTAEANKEILNNEKYNKCMLQFNKEQREVVMFHRKWCKDSVFALNKNLPVKPYCLFLSGPGGVGKSFVVKMIHRDTKKIFQCARQVSPSDIPILLTAATGVAAHNINGITVHSAFSLTNRNRRQMYSRLGSDVLNTTQNALEQLYAVIIDEISMIGVDMLYKIHMRLEEIKRMKNTNTRFGNVTITAVGDLYQLPPFKDKKIYKIAGDREDPTPVICHGSLWVENFHFHELTQIVRQQDKEFAALLNRVRKAEITENDIAILQSRLVTPTDPKYFTDALHLFGTNTQADNHNTLTLGRLNSKIYQIPSDDIVQDRETRQISVNIQGKKRKETGGLESRLLIAEQAHVKLTCNIDVSDGLVNGARGVVQQIITKRNGNGETDDVLSILVKFEDENTGRKAQGENEYATIHPGTVQIKRYGTLFQYHNKVSIFRRQFPLVLAWGSTIHSVQGLTVDKIVVDLSRIFASRKAYVALSCVKTLEGLQLLCFKKSAIRKDVDADKEMQRLQIK